MLFWIALISIELLTFLVLKEHYYRSSKLKFYINLTINLLLSICLWFLFIKTHIYKGFFDDPGNIRDLMNLSAMILGVVVPRILVTAFHYTGRLLRFKKGGHSRGLTETGIVISALFFIIISLGITVGRFNFKTENVTIKIKGLDPRLGGLKIVHLSDMHLASFYNHNGRLQDVIERVNSMHPDLIINTGDFVSFGWREFDRCDTILAKASSRFGSLAVLGNHDMGTYLPGASEAVISANILKMKELVTASGYRLLDNGHIFIDIRGARVEFAGVETRGRFPDMVHTNISKAMSGTDSADFNILLIHDPNQWKKDVVGKAGADLSFAGHTHGMQIGILTNKFRWSPAKYIYPEWNGLFSSGDQHLYVNRGLGVLAIPFRIWMPPEITVITLAAE